jgi:hypothetical protein
VTTTPVIVNCAVVAPAGTVTLAGMLAAGFVSASDTTAPPAGAGPVSVTWPVEVLQPPGNVAGERVKAERVGLDATVYLIVR